MLDDFRNTYETDEQIVDKIKNIIINIIEDGGSISPEDDTITELVDLITELLPEKMIIKPEGTLEITENGEYDVMNKAGVDVEVPLPSGTIQITQNGTTNVNDYEYANVNVVDLLGEFVRNNVTNFEIPEGVTSVGSKVFKDYTNLEEVTIPNSVTTLSSEAFSGCTNLTTVNGGFGVYNIGTNAFYNCPSILSNGLTWACKWAQYNGILTIDGRGEMKDYGGSILPPAEWKNSIKIIINNGVTGIGSDAFKDCTGLTSVTIGNSVERIGSSAFYGCTGLTSVTIPDSVTSFGSEAFYGCTNLTDIIMGNNVMTINANTFDETAWYNNQPNGLTYVGKYAYKYKGTMPDNTSISFQDSTKGIANLAFYNCTGLVSVTIPDSVERIGSFAFAGCTSLTDIYYTGTQVEWEAIAGISNIPNTTTIHYNYTPSN